MVGCSDILWVLLLFLCQAVIHNGMKTNENREWFVTTLVNESAHLPCLLEPRIPKDKPKLLLWYRRAVKHPVLSYDGRLSHHAVDGVEEGRRILNLTSESGTLVLKDVAPEDAGSYECRVDYFKSPAHTSVTHLTVVEPIQEMDIRDLQGRIARKGFVGPFTEGEKMVLICSVEKGSPAANISWWERDRLLDKVIEEDQNGRKQNILSIPNLTRRWSNTSLTCTASNTKLVSPLEKTVRLKLYLYPQNVEISPAPIVREGELIDLRCSSKGSDPPATLTWSVNGKERPADKENTQYRQVTTSTLVLKANRKDNGAKVTCTASNREAPRLVLTNSTVLSIQYPPNITASLGRSIKTTQLKEGDDVYFNCNIDANPPVALIHWFHENDVEVVQNVSQGVILSGDSLVLQKVSRTRVGRYRCRGANPLAAAKSNWVRLSLKYKPQCRTPETTFFLYDDPINVTCSISAFPAVSSIQWKWNSSKDVFDSSATPIRERKDLFRGVFLVSPEREVQDRQLACYAHNEIGAQEEQCKFMIKVASIPAPLSTCRLANITASSLNLTCDQPTKPSLGLTSFRAEVYLRNGSLYYNVTSRRPNFSVGRLDPATNYQIKVYVSRGPVTSPPVVVSAYTSRSSPKTDDEDRLGYSTSRKSGFWMIGTVLVALLITIIVARFWVKKKNRRRSGEEQRNDKSEDLRERDKISPSDEINPDVVPHIEETYDLLSALEGKQSSVLFDIIKKPDMETLTLTSSSHCDPYEPVTLCRSSSMERMTSSFQGPSSSSMEVSERRRSLVERPLPLKRSKEVYCHVDHIMSAEESVV